MVPVPANADSGIQGPTSLLLRLGVTKVFVSLFVFFSLFFFSYLFTSSAAKFCFLFPALLVAPYARRLVFLSPQIILGIFDLFLLLLIIHIVFLDIGDNHVL